MPGKDPEVEEWESQENKKWQNLRMAVYAAMIDRLDLGIGAILRAHDHIGAAGQHHCDVPVR